MTLRIIAAACRFKGLTLTLPAPARHHNILHAMHYAGWDDEFRGEIEQGFLDSEGAYRTREEAYDIANAAGQIEACGRGPHREGRLFSEDVW